jgi:hypothetical protein
LLPWSDLPNYAEGVVCLTGCRKGRLSRLVGAHRFDEALVFAKQLKGGSARIFMWSCRTT